MRRFVLLAVSVLAVHTRTASANQCNVLQPLVATPQVPVGCPLVMYVYQEAGAAYVPFVTAQRGDTAFDATGTVEQTVEIKSVWFETIDEQCTEHDYYADKPFDVYSISLVDVVAGDVVSAGGWSATITAAGPCPEPKLENYQLSCTDPYQDYQACHTMDVDDRHAGHDHGCNAGASAGLAAAALLLGLRRRRRATARR